MTPTAARDVIERALRVLSATLGDDEREALSMRVRGESDGQIAATLNWSARHVDGHLRAAARRVLDAERTSARESIAMHRNAVVLEEPPELTYRGSDGKEHEFDPRDLHLSQGEQVRLRGPLVSPGDLEAELREAFRTVGLR